jgi:predicted nucleic acid-binding Zn ribbon protein
MAQSQFCGWVFCILRTTMPKDESRYTDIPTHILCPACNTPFAKKRANQTYCSEKCRKNHFQKRNRKVNPVNARNSRSKAQDELWFFDSAMRLAEMIYTMPVHARLGFMFDLISRARSGNKKLRQILTNGYLLKAGPDQRRLFYRRSPGIYWTIAQAADRYCRKYWGHSVYDVVYGIAPEPPTGEVEA